MIRCLGLQPPSLSVTDFVAAILGVLRSAASRAPVLGFRALSRRRTASLFVLFAGIPIGVVGHAPLTRPACVDRLCARLVVVARCVAPNAGIRRRIHLKAD